MIIPPSEYTGWGTQMVIQLTLGGLWLVMLSGEGLIRCLVFLALSNNVME